MSAKHRVFISRVFIQTLASVLLATYGYDFWGFVGILWNSWEWYRRFKGTPHHTTWAYLLGMGILCLALASREPFLLLLSVFWLAGLLIYLLFKLLKAATASGGRG